MQINFFLLALLCCYIGVTCWQLGFYRLVFARLAYGTPPKSRLQERQKNSLSLPFSVIICARNEADNLRMNLREVLHQDYSGDWELIVVDDASSDDTPQILSAFQQEYPRLKVIRLVSKLFPGKKYALEQGIAASRYEQILLTDADCVPASTRWLAGMAKAMGSSPETEIVLGYGPMRRSTEPINPWVRYETAVTAMQYFSFASIRMPYMGVGRNLAIKKSVFQRVGGFALHQHIPSGDDDLLINAGATTRNVAACLEPDAFVFSTGKKTLREWLVQKRRHLGAATAYRWQHQILLASVSLSQVLHYFLGALLLLSGYQLALVLFCYALRLIVLRSVYRGVFSLFQCSDLLRQVLWMDILQAIYAGIFVPLFLLDKRENKPWA